MRRSKKIFPLIISIWTLVTYGCAIHLGPEWAALQPSKGAPVVRLGEITETMTGTWTAYVRHHGTSSAFQGPLLEALRDPAAEAYFSGSAPLTLDIHLTSDHEADDPRLANLGALSIATLGIIPLNYFSEWNVTCDVKITERDGTLVTDYIFHERGTYSIWAFPLTMFTLFGAGIRGNRDFWKIADRVSNNLAEKILQAIEADYPKLARKAGVQETGRVESYAEPPKPIIT